MRNLREHGGVYLACLDHGDDDPDGDSGYVAEDDDADDEDDDDDDDDDGVVAVAVNTNVGRRGSKHHHDGVFQVCLICESLGVSSSNIQQINGHRPVVYSDPRF